MKKSSQPPVRKLRADAARNRQRILEVAKEMFTEQGAQVNLDDIAKQAGVGAGTLYRNFASRDQLLEAVYCEEAEKLAAAEKELSRRLPPGEALRAWMLLFVDYIATKKIIAPALSNLMGNCPKVFEASGERIKRAINGLAKRAIANGNIRADMDPLDLLRALVGVAYMENGPDWRPSARRLVEILMTGLRPQK